MTDRTQILNELESLAPELVNAPVAMPYQVPAGYFETLPVAILGKLGLDENHALAPHIVKASRENLYEVPDGYFAGLADIVMARIKKQEQQDAVPEGYFNSLPDILLNKVRSLEVQSELEELAPLLNTINKQPVHFVPRGYFENLQPTIKETQEEPAKVVSIKRRTGWLKYAVAACFTGAIAFTAVNIFNKKPIAQIPVAAVNINDELSKLPDATIENYLTKEGVSAEANTIAYQAVKADEIKDFLQEFSDEELQQYLENEGEAIASN